MLDYVCPVCRTSVDLDAAIAAAVDDVQARRLMDYLIKTYQPTLAAQVVRYLRLHTRRERLLARTDAPTDTTETTQEDTP